MFYYYIYKVNRKYFLPNKIISAVSPDDLVSHGISSQIQKARLAFTNLRHLWCWRNIRVYCPLVHFVLFFGCETWPLRIRDINRLIVFDHMYIRSIVRIFWNHWVGNAWVRNRVFGKDEKSMYEVVILH